MSRIAQCPNGHYYNADIHSSCPQCGGISPTAPAAGGGYNPDFSSTVAPDPSGSSGNFVKTEPLPTPGAASGAAGPTIPADPRNANGSAVNPFDKVTQISGDIKSAGQTDPVVGWLVCVDGPVRGTDYRLHVGYNYIGREQGDIHIQGDNQISREKTANVGYHNRTRQFYVSPVEGRNIIEVNGEPVFNAVKLNPYDIITIGTSRLIFVPLCGEHFVWENPDKKPEGTQA